MDFLLWKSVSQQWRPEVNTTETSRTAGRDRIEVYDEPVCSQSCKVDFHIRLPEPPGRCARTLANETSRVVTPIRDALSTIIVTQANLQAIPNEQLPGAGTKQPVVEPAIAFRMLRVKPRGVRGCTNGLLSLYRTNAVAYIGRGSVLPRSTGA